MQMTIADAIYAQLLAQILSEGDKVVTRNSETFSHINLPNVTFDSFPLVTLRKTQWSKAIREMEWFFSGYPECPEELLNWWDGQLNENNCLFSGYGVQFREFISFPTNDYPPHSFDQIQFILNALRTNPNSRRLLMTVWNPGEMAVITETNGNPNTPTCCHSIVVQFFVRDGALHMKTYQRSADMLLGVPHNWVQSWAMLMYFAHHANLKVGTMAWMWGDAHIYNEQSHMQAANEIIGVAQIAYAEPPLTSLDLQYTFDATAPNNDVIPEFRTNEFTLFGEIPKPTVLTKPKLL